MSCFLSIRDAINRGGKEYHFLWGRYEYKYRLMGVQRDLDRLVIYRSQRHLLLNANVALKTAFRGYGRQLKQWMLDDSRKGSLMSRLSIGFWNGLQRLS